jgi:hypothetical protein
VNPLLRAQTCSKKKKRFKANNWRISAQAVKQAAENFEKRYITNGLLKTVNSPSIDNIMTLKILINSISVFQAVPSLIVRACTTLAYNVTM